MEMLVLGGEGLKVFSRSTSFGHLVCRYFLYDQCENVIFVPIWVGLYADKKSMPCARCARIPLRMLISSNT